MKRLAALLLPVALLAGCATSGIDAPTEPVPQHLLADTRFEPPSEAIDTSKLFEISPAMQAYIRSDRFQRRVRDKGPIIGLMEALYEEGDLRLDYDGTRTMPASQTFDSKAGNCMSLVIMTAAFAQELNVKVVFQEVRVDETWSREGTLYFANSHVNILLGKHAVESVDGYYAKQEIVVDFLPSKEAALHKSYPISERKIKAMYANNRAAEALIAGRLDDAYWWARESLSLHSGLPMAYNTLGVIYQRHGDNALAEAAFRSVLKHDPNNLLALRNLEPVLELLGKKDEAAVARSRLASLDPYPPFHFFQLGQEAMKQQDYRRARAMFAREVARAPYYHEFHYWHALASLQLGESEAARKELALAMETSTTPGNRARYSAKLEHLRAMRPAPRRR